MFAPHDVIVWKVVDQHTFLNKSLIIEWLELAGKFGVIGAQEDEKTN
jgi:hypothetical protein